ncbi:MAG: enoyl-CoA hydratase/isomerase family protein [Pseudomonadota bacterium]
MQNHEDYRRLAVEKHGSTLIVTLATGHKANALCFETMHELTSLANLVAEDMSIAAVVLAGKDGVFTSGMDLSALDRPEELAPNFQERRRNAALGAKMCRAWESIEAITIAAIEGPCVGGGVALSLALDLRVCAKGSWLYVPEIERGMNMSWQSVPRSVALIGPAKTKRMLVLAERVSAELALSWGWADYECDTGESVAQATALAARVGKMPPIPARMCKQAINASSGALHHAVSYMDADQLLLTHHTEDFREGVASFLEKREPNYKGN